MIAVLTADLIDSTLYDEEVLKKVLDTLSSEFDHITREYKKNEVLFNIYRGDSLQGITKDPAIALLISLQIKAAVIMIHLQITRKSRTYSKIADSRIAIGIGS